MLRIAFAGFRHGHIFSLYEWARVNEEVTVAAAWEENDAAREEARNRGVEFTCTSYDDILNDDSIDAVAIGDYYGIRGQRIIAALKAGKHVVTDKPVCTSLEELDEIERLTKESGLKLGCMLDLRYTAQAVTAYEAVKSGRLGAIHAVSFGGQHPLNYGKRPSWYFEKGKHGGTINDIAIHGIDLVRYITGLETEAILSARCWNAYADKEPDFKDCAQFMAVLGGGAGIIADVSYSLPCGCGFSAVQPWRFTFWGDKGVMEFKAGEGEVLLEIAGEQQPEKTILTVPSRNTIDDFLADISGNPNALDTDNVIKSTRTVLEIQKFSDINDMRCNCEKI